MCMLIVNKSLCYVDNFFVDGTLILLLYIGLCSFLFEGIFTLLFWDKLSFVFVGMLNFSLLGMLKSFLSDMLIFILADMPASFIVVEFNVTVFNIVVTWLLLLEDTILLSSWDILNCFIGSMSVFVFFINKQHY